MRTKIIIGFSFVLGSLVVFLPRSASLSSPVSIGFTGYSDEGRRATFVLTNHTDRYVDHSHPRIQFQTPGGWTNYYDRIEMMMCRLLGPMGPRQITTLSATLPEGERRWRASVTYQVMPDYETGWRRAVNWLRECIHASPGTNEFAIVTPEIVR